MLSLSFLEVFSFVGEMLHTEVLFAQTLVPERGGSRLLAPSRMRESHLWRWALWRLVVVDGCHFVDLVTV